MKSAFTLCFLLSFTLLQAQDLMITPTQITLTSEAGDYIGFGETVLTNNGTETLELAIRLERVCLNSGDEITIQVCMDQLCYLEVNETTTWGVDTPTAPVILEPGESTNLFKFTPDGVSDFSSEWNVVFFERTNEINNALINVVIEDTNLTDCTPTSVTDFDYSIGKAYPNPATDIINIAYQIDVNEAQLNIYNSLGMKVESVTISPQAETVGVNVADYVAGVYFYNVTDGKGQSKMLSFVK